MTITETPTKISGIVKRGAKFCVRWRDADGDSRRTSFATFEEAKRFQADNKVSLMAGTYIDPKDRKMSINTWSEIWTASRVWRDRTARRHRAALKNHVLPRFTGRTLSNIKTSEVQTWVNEMVAAGLAPTSIESYYGTFAQLMRAAVNDGRLSKSPCVGIKLPDPEHEVDADAVLEPADVIRVVAALPESYRLVAWLGAMAGLRIGESLGLRLDAIDFEGGVIDVREQWNEVGAFAPPKTRRSKRKVPLPDELATLIREHVASFGLSTEGTLFTLRRSRRPLSHSAWHDIWGAHVKPLGLPAGADTVHAMRHHYVTTLADSGMFNIKEISRFAGHSSTTITADLYTHVLKRRDKVKVAFAGRYDAGLRVVPEPAQIAQVAS